jgi:hypothetical protein
MHAEMVAKVRQSWENAIGHAPGAIETPLQK